MHVRQVEVEIAIAGLAIGLGERLRLPGDANEFAKPVPVQSSGPSK
jgi:hypothetical protein